MIDVKNCKDVLLMIVETTMWVTWEETTIQEDELQISLLNKLNLIKIDNMSTYTLWVTRVKVLIKRHLQEIRNNEYNPSDS